MVMAGSLHLFHLRLSFVGQKAASQQKCVGIKRKKDAAGVVLTNDTRVLSR